MNVLSGINKYRSSVPPGVKKTRLINFNIEGAKNVYHVAYLLTDFHSCIAPIYSNTVIAFIHRNKNKLFHDLVK